MKKTTSVCVRERGKERTCVCVNEKEREREEGGGLIFWCGVGRKKKKRERKDARGGPEWHIL